MRDMPETRTAGGWDRCSQRSHRRGSVDARPAYRNAGRAYIAVDTALERPRPRQRALGRDAWPGAPRPPHPPLRRYDSPTMHPIRAAGGTRRFGPQEEHAVSGRRRNTPSKSSTARSGASSSGTDTGVSAPPLSHEHHAMSTCRLEVLFTMCSSVTKHLDPDWMTRPIAPGIDAQSLLTLPHAPDAVMWLFDDV